MTVYDWRDSLYVSGIQQYKTDVDFCMLMERVNENLYTIPKYQRKFRWTEEQAVLLIESLICGLPIPPVYACRNEQNQLEILDGQQRMLSLFFYYIGFYLDHAKNQSADFSELVIENCSFKEALMSQFALKEFHIQMKNKDGKLINLDYAALPPDMKMRVDHTLLTVIEIKINEEEYRSRITRKIFANLNTSGTILTRQEQRNGIYVCPFYDMIRSINRSNDKWRKIWGKEESGESDMEMLLWFCALRQYVSIEKHGPSDFDFRMEESFDRSNLLDRFSEETMEFDVKQVAEYKDSLLGFFELFTDQILKLSQTVLLESFYIVYEKLDIHNSITSAICQLVLKNPGYTVTEGQNRWTMKSRNERWKTVYEIWTGDAELYC